MENLCAVAGIMLIVLGVYNIKNQKEELIMTNIKEKIGNVLGLILMILGVLSVIHIGVYVYGKFDDINKTDKMFNQMFSIGMGTAVTQHYESEIFGKDFELTYDYDDGEVIRTFHWK